MRLLIWVGLGGFLGSILRFLISGWIQNGLVTFPLGTLGVNFLGSFFLSIIMYLSEFKGLFNEETRVFMTIGVMGSLTTMSTFGYESFKLIEQNEMIFFWLNAIGSLTIALLGIYLGKLIALSLPL